MGCNERRSTVHAAEVHEGEAPGSARLSVPDDAHVDGPVWLDQLLQLSFTNREWKVPQHHRRSGRLLSLLDLLVPKLLLLLLVVVRAWRDGSELSGSPSVITTGRAMALPPASRRGP